MRAYCYWPFARAEDSAVFAAIPEPGDHLVLEVLDRPGSPRQGTDRLTVRSDLPEVDLEHTGGPRRAVSRGFTYLGRTRQRRRTIGAGAPDGGPFDVVHLGFLNRFGDQFAVPRLRRNHAVVCTIHDLVPHTPRLPRRVEHRVTRNLHRSLGQVIVHHGSLRTALVEDVALDPDRVHVVPLWITPTIPAGTKRTLSDEPTVLFQGTFRQNKGLDTLISAIAELQGQGLRFVIAGRGDPQLEVAVRDAARRYPNLRAEIGPMSPLRKKELLLDADVAVLPYTSFLSQSAVLNDAFGAHLPVVASDVGALGETVRTTGAGTAATAGDTDSLAAALLDLLGDETRWTKAADAAAAVALNHSPERTGARFREVYEIVRTNP